LARVGLDRPLPAPAVERAFWARPACVVKDMKSTASRPGRQPTQPRPQGSTRSPQARCAFRCPPSPSQQQRTSTMRGGSQAIARCCPGCDHRMRMICRRAWRFGQPARGQPPSSGASRIYVAQSQALTIACRPGHVSGPPVSGWWQRRAHLATSYSKVGVASARTTVSGNAHRGQGRVSRRMTVDMNAPPQP